MNIDELRHILTHNKTLSVYQLAILDFLNGAKKSSDIAGDEPSQGPISDDPGYRGRGYDIGHKVAARILKRRKELGGRFKSIYELADIPYFGVDKLQDLVYTYMKLRSPIPTGLGHEFDDFIMALSRLEIAAYRKGFTSKQTVSLVRKIFFDQKLNTESSEDEINLDWANIVPASAELNIPNVWATSGSLIEAMDYIRRKQHVRIGSDTINTHLLIAGIEARLHPAKITTGHSGVKLNSNKDFAGFMMKLASTTYQTLSKEKIGANSEYSVNLEVIAPIYEAEITQAEYTTTADIHNIQLDSKMSLSWNLLNYYTNSEKPSKSRYTNLAASLNLGEYKDGFLSNDNNRTRTLWVTKMNNSTFFLLNRNNKRSLVSRMLEGKTKDASFVAYRVANAFVLDIFFDRLLLLVGLEQNEPVVVSWNRLEARPRTDDFSRALRAEVRDALWFISRQWQFGEFAAEDTGSALEMRVDMQTTEIEKYSLKKEEAVNYNAQVPLEAIVEAEIDDPDLTTRMSMGQYFEKLIRDNLSSFAESTVEKVILDFKKESNFQFSLPSPKVDFPQIYSNPILVKHLMTIANGRMLDGEALFNIFKSGNAASGFVDSVNNANVKNKVDLAAEEYMNYYAGIFVNPLSNSVSAWNPQQLEYQFHASIPSSTSSYSVLSTNEYANGHLDWYSFDFEREGKYERSLVNESVTRSKVKRKLITLLPSDLQYPGMPMPRWWQFEDYKLNIGGIGVNTNELPKLLMAEFALIYSNDWMLIPFDVNIGSLCEVKSLVVRDVFGQYTSIDAAGTGIDKDWQRWSMFNLNRIGVSTGAADTRMFVPPAVIRNMEGESVEQVSLIRDEMSNMVWGIESKVPDDLGGSMDGSNAARRYYNFLESMTTPPSNSSNEQVENTAAIDYKLGTTVPENWIPFIPVRLGNVNSREIQLRRAAMPRIIEGRKPERIRPGTDLLRTGYDKDQDKWDPYFIYEEEVPRSGVIVKRSWQRTRWKNGRNFTWLGRRVTNGRGEANSGLQYDLVVDKE